MGEKAVLGRLKPDLLGPSVRYPARPMQVPWNLPAGRGLANAHCPPWPCKCPLPAVALQTPIARRGLANAHCPPWPCKCPLPAVALQMPCTRRPRAAPASLLWAARRRARMPLGAQFCKRGRGVAELQRVMAGHLEWLPEFRRRPRGPRMSRPAAWARRGTSRPAG